MSKWLKYADAPILMGEQWDREQATYADGEYRSIYEKPVGFWITDDSEDCWRSWCIGERFGLERLTYKHEIVLDETNLLILRSQHEIEHFNRQFGSAYWWGDPPKHRNWCIDWWRVAEQYDGIIITPYQWHCRMGFQWYYGWDCASGCIWKARAIRDIRLIEIDFDVAKPREPEAEAA